LKDFSHKFAAKQPMPKSWEAVHYCTIYTCMQLFVTLLLVELKFYRKLLTTVYYMPAIISACKSHNTSI